MSWNLEKLEQERLDLIKVIAALRRVERLSQTDRTSLFKEITAHMERLSELDAEKPRIQSTLEAF
ncbi:hypothetical protein [Agrobacterium sp. B1(2019)]|uniref:hypothetical protein n=1 Tax=Agrobacterium sp. B1(2019) TaxID=2607032 RepID=UPI0011EBCE60|nr:hypothetical protein [Agrobacterium sp. B1(2019)]TZG36667.1 hypothetical protein AGR1_04000 [Agrobacterium sp. B1(2019)]